MNKMINLKDSKESSTTQNSKHNIIKTMIGYFRDTSKILTLLSCRISCSIICSIIYVRICTIHCKLEDKGHLFGVY